MILKNKAGEKFDLSPDTLIEIERTNPFFKEWGEQSLPVVLPPTERNKQLLDQIQHIANRKRVAKMDVYLHEGVYNVKAQMVLLSYSDKEGFECSLLLNEGALNSKVKDITLADIFRDETVKFESVDACVNYLRQVMMTDDERFAIFLCQSLPDENGKCSYLNRFSQSVMADGFYDFLNRQETTETVDDKIINIPAGCYITPFVKTNYILKRVFAHLGYTFIPGFLATMPFANMVVLNNTADTIVAGEIRMTDVLPDCEVNALLNVFRQKFCMEFITDDVRQTVTSVLFNEVSDSLTEKNLTAITVWTPSITYPENYRQLKLHSECIPNVLSAADNIFKDVQIDAEQSDYISLKNLYPDALLDRNSGTIYRLGVKGHKGVIDGVGSLNTDYYMGGDLTAEEVECDDYMPGMSCAKSVAGVTLLDTLLVVGDLRWLHTRVVMDNEKQNTDDEEESGDREVSNTDELKIMLALTCRKTGMGRDIGTLSAYYFDNKIWNYSLFWNGADGLFERFWRKKDDLLRNSLHQVSADLLLSEADKMQLSSAGKVMLHGQELLPDTIRYVVGRKEISTCDYYTTALMYPASSASEQKWPKVAKYCWIIHSQINPSRRYVSYDVEPETIYYDPPTDAQYQTGGRYHQRTLTAKVGNTKDENGNITDPVDGSITVWLEPLPTSFPFSF